MKELGARMKEYESREAGRRFIPLLPVCARIDGKCFSNFTRGLERPFDKRLSDLMCETTAYLVGETQAEMGYAQSDEISLVWYSADYESKIFFDGRIQKINSVLAAMASAYFNRKLETAIPEKTGELPTFDCRVWQVPTLTEAANVFLWRELDATKNSISMAARCFYSHKELHKKSSNEMQELLFQKGVNWNDYPAFFKRGTFVQKRKVARKFTAEEIEKLPPEHEARKNPDLVFERAEMCYLDMPPFGKVTNREAVIFQGVEPRVDEG